MAADLKIFSLIRKVKIRFYPQHLRHPRPIYFFFNFFAFIFRLYGTLYDLISFTKELLTAFKTYMTYMFKKNVILLIRVPPSCPGSVQNTKPCSKLSQNFFLQAFVSCYFPMSEQIFFQKLLSILLQEFP
jgi:hypothetical protein